MRKVSKKLAVFFIIFSFIFVHEVKPASAQVMDVAQLIQDLLSSYQDNLEIKEGERTLENTKEQTRKRGLFGVLDKIKNTFGDLFKDGNFSWKNIDPKINKELEANAGNNEDLGEAIDKEYNLDMLENPENISEKVFEIQQKYQKDLHISAATSYGLAMSSRAILQKESFKEEDVKAAGETAEDIRSNVKALTALSNRTILQMSNIKYMQAKIVEMNAYSKYKNMTMMEVVDADNALELGKDKEGEE